MKISTEKDSNHYIVIAINLLLLFALLYMLFNTLGIFFGVFTYAIIFSVSLHNVFEKLVAWLGNRRKLAGFIFGLVMLGVIALPLIYMISVVTHYFQNLREFISGISNHHVPPLPERLESIPFIGDKAKEIWSELESDPKKVMELYGPQIRAFFQHMISAGGGILGATSELILGIIIATIFLTVEAKKIVAPLEAILVKLTGVKQGVALLHASGKAIRGVAFGVMGTGFIAAIMAWIGYSIAGIHMAAILAAITFFLVVIQIGPGIIVVGVVIYLANRGETGMAVFVGIYGVIVLMGIDHVLKPILISRSGKLPVLVLFLGVVGGMAAWGFTGMFKGAIVLSLFYTLFNSWISINSKQIEESSETIAAATDELIHTQASL